MNGSLTKSELSLLLHCPLFLHMTQGDIQQICALPAAQHIRCSRGQILYHPTQFARCLGILLEGQLKVTNGSLHINTLQPGQLFGAAALYLTEPTYAVTLTAHTPVYAILFPQDTIDELLSQHPQLRHNYLSYLSSRIHFLSRRLRSVTQSSVESKLAQLLLGIQKNGLVFTSATSLAKQLGISRASIYRAFDALEHTQLISRSGKTITLLDLNALQSFSHSSSEPLI